MASIRPSRSTSHAVGLGSEVGVVSDDDEGLAEFVAQIEEELVKALLIRRVKAP